MGSILEHHDLTQAPVNSDLPETSILGRSIVTSRPKDNQTWGQFDLPSIRDLYVGKDAEGYDEIALQVEGIKCARCGITVEKALRKLDGVREGIVNVPTARLQLKWHQSAVQLSTILQYLAQIGYPAHPLSKRLEKENYLHSRRRALKRLLVAGLGTMQVMTFALATYFGASASENTHFFWAVSMLVATPVVFYSGAPFFMGAWRAIRLGQLGMDVPVAVAIGSAYCASVYVTFFGGEHVYFESATMFVFFLSLGRYFDAMARHRAIDQNQALVDVLPETTVKLVDEEHQIVPTALLQPNDCVVIKPGAAVPADGTVVWGQSDIDESLLTGESTPILKTVGDFLMGGSINHSGVLRMNVDGVGQDTTVATINKLMLDAQASKPRWGQIADRVAGYFVSAVLTIATITGIIWWQIDPSRVFTVVLSVLVVTCPCALSLAVPTALAAATTALAKQGVLIIKGHTLEVLSRVTHIVLDKTGTLTQGKPTIRHIAVSPQSDLKSTDCLRLAASLEQNSEHPYAGAFANVDSLLPVDQQNVFAGEGIEGVIDGCNYRIGTKKFTLQSGKSDDLETANTGVTSIYLSQDKTILARFDLDDRLRPDATDVIAKLNAMNISVSIASGDQQSAVRSIAQKIGVNNYKARMTPTDKLNYVKKLQRDNQIVAMFGDGINDAPVLAGADVSFAMRQGTSMAHTSSDALLPGRSLKPLIEVFGLARRAVAIMRGNFVWAVAYNLIALPLAMLGMIAPWMAAIGMSISSVVVVANAMRLSVGPQTS